MFHHRIVKRVNKADEGTQSYEYAVQQVVKNPFMTTTTMITGWKLDPLDCYIAIDKIAEDCIRNEIEEVK